jgi:hypothetical protein
VLKLLYFALIILVYIKSIRGRVARPARGVTNPAPSSPKEQGDGTWYRYRLSFVMTHDAFESNCEGRTQRTLRDS